MAKDTKEEEPLNPGEAKDDERLSSDNATEEGVPEVDKKTKIKRLLLIIVPIILTIAGLLYFFFFVIKAPKSEDQSVTIHSKGQPQNLQQNTYLDIEQVTVRLATENKKTYVRLDIAFRLNNEEESQYVKSKMPILKDTLINFLRTLRKSDFQTTYSTHFIKQELIKRFNKITAPVEIKEVLFQEFILD